MQTWIIHQKCFFGLVPTNNLRFTTFYRVTSSLALLSIVVLYLVGLQEVHAHFTVWKSKNFGVTRILCEINLVKKCHLDEFEAPKSYFWEFLQFWVKEWQKLENSKFFHSVKCQHIWHALSAKVQMQNFLMSQAPFWQ